MSKIPHPPAIQEQDRRIKNVVFVSLHLYIPFRFRMKQVNIVGSSPFSQPSRMMQTLQSSPDVAPSNLIVFSASETSLRIRWEVRNGHTHTPNKGVLHVIFFKYKIYIYSIYLYLYTPQTE